VPKPWNASFLKAQREMQQNLFITNPVVQQALAEWGKFINLRAIDVREFHSSAHALDLAAFARTVTNHIEKSQIALHQEWFGEIVRIFHAGNRKNQIKFERIDGFFNSVALMMSRQLRDFVFNSIQDYVSLVVGDSRFPGFVIKLIIENNEAAFDPSFNSFEDAIIAVIDQIVASVKDFPRVETELFSKAAKSSVLNPPITANMIDDAKQKILTFLQSQQAAPKAHVKEYEKYAQFISGQADADFTKFLEEERPFKDLITVCLSCFCFLSDSYSPGA
jgi:dynein heavy chain